MRNIYGGIGYVMNLLRFSSSVAFFNRPNFLSYTGPSFDGWTAICQSAGDSRADLLVTAPEELADPRTVEYDGRIFPMTTLAWSQICANINLIDWRPVVFSWDPAWDTTPPGGISIVCATDDGICHNGVGLVTVTSQGTTLYSGCAGQGLLELSGIEAGTTISIGYTAGSCGGHQCNAAIFRLELVGSGGNAVLGTANLNNEIDGGDRGPFTFTVTQADIDSLSAP